VLHLSFHAGLLGERLKQAPLLASTAPKSCGAISRHVPVETGSTIATYERETAAEVRQR
jgi:hypothetical protein